MMRLSEQPAPAEQHEEAEPATTVINRMWDTLPPHREPQHEIADHIRGNIDWESAERDNIATFPIDGTTYHIRYSTPVHYAYKAASPKIVDLLVVGTDPDDVGAVWSEELAKADSEREHLRQRVRDDVLPELESIGSLVTVLGRGSVYDPRRVTEHGPDVDLILFFDSPLDTTEQIDDVTGTLNQINTKHPDIAVTVTPYTIAPGTSKQITDPEVTTDSRTDMVVMLDIMSFTGKTSYTQALLSHLDSLKPYDRDCLVYGEVLMDRSSGTFEEIREAAAGAGR
jgi:hypothetical protein